MRVLLIWEFVSNRRDVIALLLEKIEESAIQVSVRCVFNKRLTLDAANTTSHEGGSVTP
jgi:hypothetical protein